MSIRQQISISNNKLANSTEASRQAHAIQYYAQLSFYSEEKTDTLLISYLININASEFSLPNKVFLINRQQVFINGKTPSSLIDKCIDYSGKCIFPAEITVNTHDGRVEAISNTKDIESRWLIAKERMYLDYKGPVVDLIVAQMEQAMSSNELITKAVKKDLFSQVFFFPLYAGHSHIKGIEMSHEFSIVSYCSPVKFICTREIIKNDAGGMNIYIKGKANDKRSFNDIVIAKMNSDAVSETGGKHLGTVFLDYHLFANGMLKTVKGYLEIEDGFGHFKKVEVDISANEQMGLNSEDFEAVIKPVVYAKKKSFWSRNA